LKYNGCYKYGNGCFQPGSYAGGTARQDCNSALLCRVAAQQAVVVNF
jgi:hypothetical protein